MKTQIKILGTIDILLGIYFLWSFWDFISESTPDFIQKEFTLTVFLIGLVIGGVGLLTRSKVGWIANQMTGIHIILSAVIAVAITGNRVVTSNSETTTFILAVLVLIVGARLFWTNKQQWLDEFKVSNRSRLMTITFGTMISLVLLLKSHV
jgi:hypothetical protein